MVLGLYADLLGYALGMVDWHEVAEAIREADQHQTPFRLVHEVAEAIREAE